jgi:hypothetical protein
MRFFVLSNNSISQLSLFNSNQNIIEISENKVCFDVIFRFNRQLSSASYICLDTECRILIRRYFPEFDAKTKYLF